MLSCTRWPKPGLLAAVAVGAMLASCSGPEYTYFRVHVTAQDTGDPATGLENLYDCTMTVQNAWGDALVKWYPLKKSFDPSGGLAQGCAGPLTKANAGEIGYFGYSTSRTVHALVFKVEGWDQVEGWKNNGNIVQSGSGGPRDIPCPQEFVASDDDACAVDVAMAP
jgi:hypothetical protein